jgi:hypothetical protein
MPATAGGVATGAGGTALPAEAVPWLGPLLLSSVAAVAVVALFPRRRGQRVARVARVAVRLVPLVLLAGCTIGSAGPAPAPGGPAGTTPTATAAPTAPGERAALTAPGGLAALAPSAARPHLEVSAFPSAVHVPGRESAPVRLTIGEIGVDTALVPLGLDAKGALQVPEDFARAGWFTGGPLPGEQGPAVIAGHVDSRGGPAVFYRLRELKAGDTVQVRRADGIRLRFVVESVHQYPKAAFPREAVFGAAAAQALRLITCGGSFDHQRHSYRDNLIVDASLTGFSQG